MFQRSLLFGLLSVMATGLALPISASAQPVDATAGKPKWSSAQRDALSAIYDHGGILLQLDDGRPDRPLIAVDFSGHCDIDNDWLRHLLSFTELTSLRLAGTAITDDGLKTLNRFPKLSHLTLKDTPITDSGLLALAECKSLKRLDVRGTGVGAVAIAALRMALPELVVETSTPRTPVSPEQALAELKKVCDIMVHHDDRLPGNPVTMIDATNGSKLMDDSVRFVIDLPELRQISFSGTPLSDAAVATLAAARRLETLSLANTKLTDAGLVRLAACRQLRMLDVTGTRVTQAGIATLRKNSPQITITAEPEKLAAIGDAAALRTSDNVDAPVAQRFTEGQIRLWRQKARELSSLPETTPEGWSKSPIDPAKLFTVFTRLRLREGYVLRAYVFKQDANSTGFVWALPADATFPEPDECPRLESHLLKPPKPFDALDDTMEAIVGDDSVASYVQASLLRRELKEFSTGWHGITWGMHMVFDDNPWAARPDLPEDSLARFPVSDPSAWKWLEAKPDSWMPEGRMDATRATVTFYSYTPLAADRPGDDIEKERIYRHTDTYRRGKYRPLVIEKKIAEGPDAIAF